MPNVRLLPPSSGAFASAPYVVKGRNYSPAVPYADVPDFDGAVLEGGGWTKVAQVGPSSQRPTVGGTSQSQLRGTHYLDTDVGALVIHDGSNWKNPATGATV